LLENGFVRAKKRDCAKMNIFILSFDPRSAAEHHCDKHVVKMILETAQLLYCAHWATDPSRLPATAYRKTHPNHPCAIWTRESGANYRWLCALGIALCNEYTFRYGKIHKTRSHIEWLVANPPALEELGPTPMRLAMPDEYKQLSPVESYRAYYIGAKSHMLKYSKRQPPYFLDSSHR
jgi:hypothetical protein